MGELVQWEALNYFKNKEKKRAHLRSLKGATWPEGERNVGSF